MSKRRLVESLPKNLRDSLPTMEGLQREPAKTITATESRSPTFCVTESLDLPNDLFRSRSYELAVTQR